MKTFSKQIAKSSSTQPSEENYCLRALQCALNLRNHRDDHLATHIAVTSGDITLAVLGGYNDEWTYIVNGPCMTELSKCIDAAGPTEVVTTKSCYLQASHKINFDTIHELTSSSSFVSATPLNLDGNYFRVESITAPVATAITVVPTTTPSYHHLPTHLPPLSSISLPNHTSIKPLENNTIPFSLSKPTYCLLPNDDEEISEEVLSDAIEAAEYFVPYPALNAIYADSLDSLAELRQVTTIFLKLDSYSPIRHENPLTLQPFFLLLQEILTESGGMLRQFLVDDKGCVAIMMWGVPCFTHANDCSRGLFCAVTISKRIIEVGHSCSIGLTTGNVFCGNVGCSIRQDFVGIGDTVNLAARLMSKAKGRVFVDAATYNNLPRGNKKNLKLFDVALELKGQKDPVRPYILDNTIQSPLLLLGDDPGDMIPDALIRQQVLETIATQLDLTCHEMLRTLVGISNEVIKVFEQPKVENMVGGGGGNSSSGGGNSSSGGGGNSSSGGISVKKNIPSSPTGQTGRVRRASKSSFSAAVNTTNAGLSRKISQRMKQILSSPNFENIGAEENSASSSKGNLMKNPSLSSLFERTKTPTSSSTRNLNDSTTYEHEIVHTSPSIFTELVDKIDGHGRMLKRLSGVTSQLPVMAK